jgi:phosphate transport system substrate-binding protein
MNDDFLHRLREAPPPAFAARLKARLDALPGSAMPVRRTVTLRGVMLGLLLGGSAFAVTAISIRSGVPAAVERWFTPERAPPSSSSTPTPSSAPRQVFPGEMVVPREDSMRSPPTGPLPAGRAPVQLASQPTDDATSARAPASASQQVDATTAAGIRRITMTIAVTPTTRAFAKSIADVLPVSLGIKFTDHNSDDALTEFCRGPNPWNAVAAITLRRIEPQELQTCLRNDVTDVNELNVGRQSLVLVRNLSGPEMKLTRREIYLALARHTPLTENPDVTVTNRATIWQQIGPIAVGYPIQVYGPRRDSPLGVAITELLLEPGCNTYPSLAALWEKNWLTYHSICLSLRTDGIYADYEGDQEAIAQNVRRTPGAIGVLPYHYFDSHRDILAAIPIEGVTPSAESIARNTYPATRELYLYVKGEHLRDMPALTHFVNAFRAAAGPRGPFVNQGLTPARKADRVLRLLAAPKDLQP